MIVKLSKEKCPDELVFTLYVANPQKGKKVKYKRIWHEKEI